VFAGLASCSTFFPFQFLTAIVALCFGGGFAVMPAFVSDCFGKPHSGTIYGSMLTPWSVGAIAGSSLITLVEYRSAIRMIELVMLGSCTANAGIRALPQVQETLAD
jgi:MFS transporter, OFA family, oxalate/formate antiporter